MPNDTCPASGHKLPDMPLPVKLMSSQDLEQVTDVQLAKFAELIYGRTGHPRVAAEEDAAFQPPPPPPAGDADRLFRRLLQYIVNSCPAIRNGMPWSRKSRRTRPFFFATKPSGTGSARITWRAALPASRRAGPRRLCGSGRPPAAPATSPIPSPARSPLRCPTGSSGRSACWAPTSAWAL